MACSRDLCNDAEVQDVLTKDSRISPNLREKPLSPVLTRGSSYRKLLIDRKLSRKKSTRVKLTDRFRQNDKEGHTVVNPINVPLPISFDDNLSTSQAETLIDHLDKLEELDNSRKNLYKVLVRNKKNNEDFKKPISPVPVKINKTEISKISESNKTAESDCTFQRSIVNEITPIFPRNLSSGFQTAKGKIISVSETDIKKHSKLFEDIIYPTLSYCEGRQNKHAFLRKSECKRSDFKTNASFNLSDNNLKCLKSSKAFKLIQTSPLENFSTTNSNIKITEKAIVQAKNLFAGEEFDDIKFNNENICGFKRASAQTFASANAPQKIENVKDIELSLTQAINDSGISNTQIINAFDDILQLMEINEQNDFKGFTKDDMKESCTRHLNMEKIVEHSHSIKEFSKKRKRSVHSVDNFNCSRECENKKENSFPSKKRVRNLENILGKVNCISKEDNLPATNNNFGGFASASGKPIAIQEKYMKGAESIFNDIELTLPQEKLMAKIENNDFSKTKDVVNNNSCMSFQKASGKSIKISENSLTKAKNIFDQLNIEISKETPNEKSVVSALTFHTKPNHLKYIKSCTEYIENKRDNCEEKYFLNCFNINENPLTSYNHLKESFNNPFRGFSKASGKELKISESALHEAKNIFDKLSTDYSYDNNDQTLVGQASTASLTNNTKIECFNRQENYSVNYSSAQNTSTSKQSSAYKETSTLETTPISLRKPIGSNLSSNSSKRKLGMSHFRPMQICDSKLDKAKLLFDEDFSGISPMKPKQTATYTSTPIKQNDYLKSINNNCPIPKNSFSSFVDAAGITPIKRNVENIQIEIPCNVNSKMMCISPTKGELVEDLEMERKKLECRLRVLLEREKLGREALHRLHIGKSDNDKKPRQGLLYRTKTTSNKISLVSFVDKRRPAEATSNTRLSINPKNAENLHFTEQTFTSIATDDAAVIIPNSKDMVGLSEIKNAFEAMPGVELRLIPKGWLKNHYKWIVWKLASYENKFPNYFTGCLRIENIMQQLKYRYDREIDRAERSAVRKICEKDDAPQKRMVLFVSDIKMSEPKKYELELCDGWYPVRTIIDEPLCNQIIKGRIEIGTKLLISGAELLNCDGCHPLEATNLVCLKINCNCTRRAIWHAKLGFQRNPNPFPIQLHTIYPSGGTIAAIRVCIARVYPLKYMEKLEGRSVWRNRRAEEIAAQKWENQTSKKLEQIEHEVRRKFKSFAKPTEYQSSDSDISNIRCPEKLFDILEKSNDPECLQQNLSVSQKESILNYQSNLSMKKQQEITTEVSAEVSKMELKKRDVVALLKLIVIDVMGDSDRPFNFSIWRPTEVHLQSLKEGKSFAIQNVLPRTNGDLNSTTKTTFKQESANDDKCIKYKRRLVSLEQMIILKLIPDFKEFDTVGIVVQTKIESHRQEVWITDNAGRLLRISVYEGPGTCSLLDNLKRGQPTTVCNLIYRDLKKDIVQAVANHFTVFSSYSQHKHLQEGLETFKKEMAKDVQNLLDDCDNKIEVFRIITDINSFSGVFDVTDDDFTTGTSLLT